MRRIFKKGLSVFLSLLMVMSSFAMLTPDMFMEAEAATAGSYHVRVYMRIYDGSDGFPNPYTVDSTTGLPTGDNMAGFTLFYKSMNGKGSTGYKTYDLNSVLKEDQTQRSDIESDTTWTEDSETSTKYTLEHFDFTEDDVGFPTGLSWILDDNNMVLIGDASAIAFTKIAIVTDGTEYVLWKGWSGGETTNQKKSGAISFNGTQVSTSLTTTDEYSKNETKGGTWEYPYAKTFDWDDLPADMVCPKSGDAEEYVHVTAKDQYGVQMFNPTWSIKRSGGTDGIYLSTTSAASGTTIKLNNSANIASDVNEQTGTITATWTGASGVAKTSSKTFKITDTTYTATFNGHKDADGVTQEEHSTTAMHGCLPVPPTAYNYPVGDYDYIFGGWDPSVEGMTGDKSYTAIYNPSEKILADYTAVDEAIAAAEAEKAKYGTDYEFKYTPSTRNALETAINTGKQNRNHGRTEQATVDGYAQTILEKLAALEPNKFAVIFLDKNGAILKYEKEAEYKSNITPPEFPEDQEMYYDADKHYTYTGWNSDEYTSVIDDMVIAPAYEEAEHIWKTEQVTSTCVQAGTTKYTCEVCGYVKYDGGDQLGDHVWDDDFTVDLEPTCVLEGSKSIHCSLCDAQKDITTIPAKGHNWEDFAVAVNPTCDTVGVSTRVCAEADCRFCEHLMIDPLGHDYKKTTVPATCTEKGYDEYVCQRDGCDSSYRDNYTDTTAPHTYGAWETVSEAHCGIAGVKKQTCEDCGHINLGTIDALEHDNADWTVVIEPVCGGKGYQVKNCSKCKNVIASEEIAALEHDFEEVYTPADCDDAGYTTKTCKRENCGHTEIVEDTDAPATGHNFVETTSITPTCTQPGEKTQTCSNCGTSTKVAIAALGHTWGAWTVTPSTNATAGSVSRECTVCHEKETVEIPAGGHKVEYKVTETPTCDKNGKAEFVCTTHENCEFKLEIELDMLQHTVETDEKAATCTAEGYFRTYCSECGKVLSNTVTKKLAHVYVAGTAVAPTCTTSGYTPYECSNDGCNESYNLYDATKPATGHDYKNGAESNVVPATCATDGSKTVKCNNCAETTEVVIPKLGHTMSGTWVQKEAPTCTADGVQEMTCTNNCGEKITAPIPALGHNWGEWEEVKASTNTEKGQLKRTCSKGCTETVEIPAGGHVLEYNVLTDATCKSTGKAVFVCTAHEDCGIAKSVTIPALGHDKQVAYNPATCEKEGSVEVTCSRCADYKETTTIPVLSHVWSEGEITKATCQTEGKIVYTCENCTATREDVIPVDANAHNLATEVKDATCTDTGSVVTKCTNEGCTHIAAEKEIAAKGHTVTVEVNAPDCENPGSIVKDCADCDEVDETIIIPALKHNYSGAVETVKDATCTDTGVRTIACVNDGCTSKKAETIEKVPHTWSDWTVIPSTNTVAGSVSRECTVCHEKETVEIPKGNHNMVKDEAASKAPTCKEEGKTVYKCADENCNVVLELEEPKLQHTVATEEEKATCTAEGYFRTYCSECGEELSKVITKKLAHVYVAGTAVAPTCTTSGYTPYECSNDGCNESYNLYDATKPATGHDYKNGAESNVVPATCATDGSKTVKCNNCAETTEVVIPKLGHNYELVSETDATCAAATTKTYKCSRCDATYTITEGEKETEHTWNVWVTVEQATNTSIGYKTRTCTVCGQIEVEKIPATGDHVFDVLNKEKSKAPTCTEAGYEIYNCSVHENCTYESRVELPALGHDKKVTYTEATCDTVGSIVTTCDRCDKVLETKEIAALGHAWGNEKVTPATCQAAGKIEYTCTRTDCGETHEVVIPVDSNAHKLETIVTPATCTDAGKVVTKCTITGCTFVDEKEISAKGHTIEIKITDPECGVDGKIVETCTVCGETKTTIIPALKHSHTGTPEVKKLPTCTEDGINWVKCVNGTCDDTIVVVVPKLGHDYDEGTLVEATCQGGAYKLYACERADCGHTEIRYEAGSTAIPHNYVETINRYPTCTAEGQKTVTCTAGCDISYTEAIPMLPHNWSDWTVTAPTHENEGSVSRECKDCDATESVAIPAGEHDMVKDEASSKAPTCKEEGLTVYKCSDATCDVKISLTEPKLQHTVATEEKAATCTEAGYIRTYCSVCGEELADRVTIKKLAHVYVAGAPVAPTCTTSGYTPYTCACGDTYNKYDADAKATGHNYEEVEGSSTAKCTEAGKMTLRCTECNDEIEADVPALGHDYVLDTSVSTDATCGAPATQTYDCSRCDAKYTISVGDKLATHSYPETWTTVKEATPTSIGYKTRTCTVCGQIEVAEIPATGDHEFTDLKETVEADCTTDGYKVYGCATHTDCGLESTVTIPALGHNESLVYTPADCDSEGSAVRHCDRCGKDLETETVAALGHAWGNEKVTPATCKAAGKIEYTCTRTGCTAVHEVAIPVDADAHKLTTEVTPATCTVAGSIVTTCANGCDYNESVVIPATGHTITTVVTDPKCGEIGTVVETCTNAGCDYSDITEIPALNHSYIGTGTVGKAPTCTENGYNIVPCANKDCETTTQVVVPMLGHEYDEGVRTESDCTNGGYTTYTCTRTDCGYVHVVLDGNTGSGHDFSGDETIITDATCTTDGSKTVKCKDCDATTTVVIPKKGHAMGNWVQTKEPTCTEDGTQEKTCANNCGEKITASVPKLGHEWGAWKVEKASTNTEKGLIKRTCAKGCEETVEIPEGGHVLTVSDVLSTDPTCTTEGKAVFVCTAHADCGVRAELVLDKAQHIVVTEKKVATCTDDGYIKTYCTKCDEVFCNETTKAIAHVYKAGTAVAPTCTTSGYTPYTCACGDTYNKYDADAKATGHNYEEVEGSSTAKCTEAGKMTLRCTECNDEIEADVPALGHDYVLDASASTEATCAAAATQTYKCSRCTAEYTISVGDKLTTHSYPDTWTTVKEATFTSIGYKTRACTVCGQIEVEVIPATGDHSFTILKETVNATCIADGKEIYSCATHTDCGLTSEVVLPKLGHDEKLVYTPATCETEGSVKRVCDRCSAELESKPIAALGHAWGNEVVVKSTCKTAGKIAYSCTRCTATHEVEIPVDATAHSYTTTVTDATCTQTGAVVVTCGYCGKSETTTIAQKGHIWKADPETTTPATCIADGKEIYECENCEATHEVVIPKLGHNWSDWTVVQPTATTDGSVSRTCSRGCTESVTILKGDHEMVEVSRVNATCESTGSIVYRCKDNCGIELTVVLDKLQHALNTTVLEPTCSKDGYIKDTCGYGCGYANTTVTPATGEHTLGDWIIVDAPTCVNNGIRKRECSKCFGEDEFDTIPATGEHTYVGNWQTVYAPTCESSGVEKDVCTVCKETSITRQTDPIGHKLVTSTTAATCEVDGLSVTTCENGCDYRVETAVPKLGHDYEKTGSTKADCTSAPTETWTCKNDESHTYTIITDVPNGHSYTGTVITQASCTNAEVTRYDCSDCDDSYDVITAVPNGHQYIDNWQEVKKATATENGQLVRYCTVCNAAPEYATVPATGAHVFEEGAYVAPDCLTEGSQAWVCTTHTNCDANYTETIPATGHQLVLDKKDATCTETGYVKLVCSVDTCGAEVDSYEVPMLCHTYTEVENSRQEATCTEPGSYKTACTCGAEQTIAIPAKGHSYTTNSFAATCTQGARTVYRCACGDTYTITTSDPLGHDWGEWTETKEATETEAGELTRECKNGCGAKETAPLAPTGEHSFVKDTDASVNATCTEGGTLVFKCTAEHDCGVTFTYDVEAKGHQLKLDYKKATCTEDGYANVYCVACGEVIEANTIDKLGHNYKAEVTTEAKCGEEGVVTYTCENCGDSYTEKVDALEHNFIVEVAGTKVAPTCITDGKVTMKCYYCDATEEKVLSKTGHMFDEGTVIIKPDCVTAGKIEYTCQYDHTHKFTEVIEPTGSHTLVGEIVEYEATCTRAARNEQYCEACGNWVVVWESTVLPAHKWNAWVVEKLPTETEDGYQYRVCSVCGEIEEMALTAGRMFRVTFYNDNGERLTTPSYYTYGAKVERPEDPIKHETDVHTFNFLGWTYGGYDYDNVNEEVAETDKMIDYLGYGFDFSKVPGENGYETQEGYIKELALVAVYEKVEKTYKVTYIDGNGKETVKENIKHSDIATSYGVPEKDASEVYTYTFREWQIVCTKDKNTGEYIATATAQFDAHVIPGQEDKVEKEPSIFMNIINSIINFFKGILAKLGIKI